MESKTNSKQIKTIIITICTLVAILFVTIVAVVFFTRDKDKPDDKEKTTSSSDEHEYAEYEAPIEKAFKMINEKEDGYIAYYRLGTIEEVAAFEEARYNIYKYVLDPSEYESEYNKNQKAINEIVEVYGSDYLFTYEVVKAKKMTHIMAREICELYDYEYGFMPTEVTSEKVDEESIKRFKKAGVTDEEIEKYMSAIKGIENLERKEFTDAYMLSLKCNIIGENGEKNFMMNNVYVVKLEDEWMLYDSEISPSEIKDKIIKSE